MKDPHDKSTIDGFADLVTLIDSAPPLKKRGRPPLGERALSAAEKQKAYRGRKRVEKQAEAARLAAIKAGEPVSSSIIDLTTDFVTAYRTVRDRS